MLVYRIALAKYSRSLIASGKAARWNPAHTDVIYTASSRSMACLENAVNRDQLGLMQAFNVVAINCPDTIQIKIISLNELRQNWSDYDQIRFTQNIGKRWVWENKSAILQVPSSIIEEEVNYLLNPQHEDFKKIKIVNNIPFLFDKRIKK